MKKRKRHITSVVSLWLLAVVVLAYVLSSVCIYTVLYIRADRESLETITNLSISNAENMQFLMDPELYDQAAFYVDSLSGRMLANPDAMQREVSISFEVMLELYSVSETNLVDRSGLIIVSTNEANVGYNLRSNPALSRFFHLFDGEPGAAAHCDGAVINDPSIVRYSAAEVPGTDTLLLCGVTQADIDEIKKNYASQDISTTWIGSTGFFLTATNEGIIRASSGNLYNGQTLSELGIHVEDDKEYAAWSAKIRVNGVPCYVSIDNTLDIYLVAIYPMEEALSLITWSLFSTLAVMTAVFAALYFVILRLMKTVVINKIAAVNQSLSAITSGRLDEKVSVRDTVEFDALSNDINATVDRLKEYIAEAAARIDRELAVAKEIQRSTLPAVDSLPPRADFALAASMDPAKEVGGDFYDFYFLDENRLALVIADVAGKGIPGAMYMMRSKALIKNRAQQGGTLSEILQDVNESLSEGNDAGMFVTVWFAVLDLATGRGTAVNAGHEHPALRRGNGQFELVKYRHSPAVATVEGVRFREHEFELRPGDCLFVYTDGVAEATDAAPALFGETRLLRALNGTPTAAPREILGAVKAAIDDFVGEAEQFDDITMLCLEYLGPEGAA